MTTASIPTYRLFSSLHESLLHCNKANAHTSRDTVMEFARFPNLPGEIRHLIWKHALHGPRLVDIRLKMSGKWETDSLVQSKDGQVHIISNQYFQPKSPLWIESTCPIPSLLLACRESFRIALPHYQRVFSCTTERVFQYKTSSPQTYFNFEHDILYMRYDTLSCTALPFCHGGPLAWTLERPASL